jgi:hypothetical protein
MTHTKDEEFDLALEALEPCDMGSICAGCSPRNVDGTCPHVKTNLSCDCYVKGFNDGMKEMDGMEPYTTPPAQPAPVPLTDEEIIKAMPGGIYDCLNDPWDCGVGDGDTLRSIKKDVLRIARAIEAAHGITEKGQP